jgi:hypothetical protein
MALFRLVLSSWYFACVPGVPHDMAMRRVKEGFIRPANVQHSVRFVDAYRRIANVLLPGMSAEELGAGTIWYNPAVRCLQPH